MIFIFNLLLVFLEILFLKQYNKKAKIVLGRQQKAVLSFMGEGELFFLVITFLQLIFFLCLRAGSVGDDTNTYLYIYHCGIGGLSGLDAFHIEEGAKIYMWLLSRWGKNDVLFLSAFAVPTILLNYRFIWKYSDDIYMSVFMFTGMMYYFLAFNMMRQSLAMAIVLQALNPAMEKKWRKFILIIVFAAMFHSSAWIFLVVILLPFLKIKINLGYFAGAIVCSALVLCIGKKVTSGVLRLLGSSYIHYLDRPRSGGSGNIMHPLMYFFILYLAVFFWKNGTKRVNYILINMLFIGTMLYMFSVRIQIMNRLPYYYTIASIVLLPNLINKIRNKILHLFAVGSVYFFVVLYEVLILIVIGKAQGVLPYVFFWEK